VVARLLLPSLGDGFENCTPDFDAIDVIDC